MTDQYADEAHRYRLENRIATGGMGVVWRATDTRLNRSVAVKVLKHEFADDPQFRTRFDTEARNAAALQHPGIAGVFDYSSDPSGAESPYLVMELVEGQPLSTLLAQARDSGRALDPEVVRDLLTQTADALAVAHRAGIVHRDVKPANLLITPDRRVKVTDFGIARAADDAQITRTGAVMGTPQYLSPEQARGNPAVSASDVYSLGVVGFECLTGRRPFEADSPVATALAHIQQPVPDLPADLPDDLRTIVARALAKDPAERYTDGAALAAALRGVDVGLPPVGRAGPGSGPRRHCRPAVDRRAAARSGRAARARRADAAAGSPGGLPRFRAAGAEARSWIPAVLLVLLLVAAAIVVIVLLVNQDDDEPTGNDDPTRSTPRSTKATTESSASEPTTPTTTADETVTIDPADYVGRDRSRSRPSCSASAWTSSSSRRPTPATRTRTRWRASTRPASCPSTPRSRCTGGALPPATTPTTETTTPTDTAGTETGSTTEGGDG